MPWLEEANDRKEPEASSTFGWGEMRSWRTGKYLYVKAPTKELYDQAIDPPATKNLAATDKTIADTLDSQLAAFQQKSSRAKTEATKLDPSQAEKLRALGYLASDSAGPENKATAEIDPKDKIDTANKFHRALVDLEEDHYDEAIAELTQVLKQDPEVSSGYLELGRALVHRERYQEALPVLRTAAEKNPSSGMAHYELALALIKTGDWEVALPEMKAAVVCSPKSAQMHFYLAAVHLRLKQVDEATTEFENSLTLEPDHFMANLKYGEMLLTLGNANGAIPKLSRAIKSDPESVEAHAALADAYRQVGQEQNSNRERAKAAQLQSSARKSPAGTAGKDQSHE